MTCAFAGAGAFWRFGERRWGAVRDTCDFLTNLGERRDCRRSAALAKDSARR